MKDNRDPQQIGIEIRALTSTKLYSVLQAADVVLRAEPDKLPPGAPEIARVNGKGEADVLR